MGRFLQTVFYLFLAVVVVASLAGLVLWKTEGLRLYSVQTGSMRPALQPGDLAISIKPARLEPGDIISYRSSANAQQIISHRLVALYPQKGFVITKGDNLAYADSAVPYSSISGRTIKVIPKAGYFIDVIHQPVGLIGLIYLPALAVSAYELSRLASRLSYRSYGLDS